MGCPIPTSFLEVSDYHKPKGPDGDMLDIGSFAQLEVTTQRDETEDVGTLEISKAPVENIPSHDCSNKRPAPEVPPAIEASTTKHVTTTEHVSIETPQGEIVGSKVIITTSTSAGNECTILNSAKVSISIAKSKNLQKLLRKLLLQRRQILNKRRKWLHK